MNSGNVQQLRKQGADICKRAYIFLKWVLFALLTGVVGGGVGIAFYYAMRYVTEQRTTNPLITLGLPFGGLVIVFLYQTFRKDGDRGTNTVISAIRSDETIPFLVAPLIFIATIITHLFGGSAGREGAALQMGGSIGNTLGRLLHMDDQDKNMVIMCGMSALFAALFGTPVAAAIFAMEVISVGVMYYAALVPCVFSAITASRLAAYAGIEAERFQVAIIPEYTLEIFVKVTVAAIFFALISMVFCIALQKAGFYYQKWLKNPYVRVFVAGILILVLTALVGTRDYMGAGMDVIARAIEGEARPWDFLCKIIFTALTLGAGYKGGEIVPSFYIGATFGCILGTIIGLPSSLAAALGMVSVFCGVTNCPISSLLIAMELFGFDGVYYYLVSIAVSYMLSGYFGLYSSQKILYSKFQAKYIDKNVHH
jgi:H+/Cl- antiporter ClcA